VILVSHDLAVISQVTDRIARDAGRPDRRAAGDAPISRAAGIIRTPKRCSRRRGLSPARVSRSVRDGRRDPRGPGGGAGIPGCGGRSQWRRPPPFRAVDGVSLTLHAGETIGLVGSPVSGKSSLLSRDPRARSATIRGGPAQGGEFLGWRPEDSYGVCAVPFRSCCRTRMGVFDPLWPVERLVAEPCHTLESPPGAAERRAKVAAVLEQVGLSAADARRHPHEFSGGQRQRIAIARALNIESRRDRIRRGRCRRSMCWCGRRSSKLLAELAQRSGARVPVRLARSQRRSVHRGSGVCDAARAQSWRKAPRNRCSDRRSTLILKALLAGHAADRGKTNMKFVFHIAVLSASISLAGAG